MKTLPLKYTLVALLAIQVTGYAINGEAAANIEVIEQKAILTIDDGDFVHPTFSPDGRYLAYSKVIVEDSTELTEIYLHDFESGKTRQLLDADSSRDYSTYKAYIYRLEWISSQRLLAYVSDGDVGTSLIEYDVITGNIVNTRFHDSEAAWFEQVSQWQQSINPLPPWKPSVIRTAFENSAQLGDSSFLIQPFHAGVEPNIYRITSSGELTQVRSATDSPGALGGAIQFNHSLLFIQGESSGGRSKQANLLLYDKDTIKILDSITTTTDPRLKALFSDQSRALFFVSTSRSYEINPGKLYQYSSSGLTEWLAPGMLYDISSSSANRMLALVFWQDNRRVIEVHSIDRLTPTK